jgi:hypothetical protein
MDFEWGSSLDWVVLFTVTFVSVVVICAHAQIKPLCSLQTSLKVWREHNTTSPIADQILIMLLKQRLRMGNADQEGDQVAPLRF